MVVTVPKAKACCYEFLRYEDRKVRLKVASCLDQFSSPDGKSFSAVLAKDVDPEVRGWAETYLKKVSPNVLRLLNQPQEKIMISYANVGDWGFGIHFGEMGRRF